MKPCEDKMDQSSIDVVQYDRYQTGLSDLERQPNIILHRVLTSGVSVRDLAVANMLSKNLHHRLQDADLSDSWRVAFLSLCSQTAVFVDVPSKLIGQTTSRPQFNWRNLALSAVPVRCGAAVGSASWFETLVGARNRALNRHSNRRRRGSDTSRLVLCLPPGVHFLEHVFTLRCSSAIAGAHFFFEKFPPTVICYGGVESLRGALVRTADDESDGGATVTLLSLMFHLGGAPLPADAVRFSRRRIRRRRRTTDETDGVDVFRGAVRAHEQKRQNGGAVSGGATQDETQGVSRRFTLQVIGCSFVGGGRHGLFHVGSHTRRTELTGCVFRFAEGPCFVQFDGSGPVALSSCSFSDVTGQTAVLFTAASCEARLTDCQFERCRNAAVAAMGWLRVGSSLGSLSLVRCSFAAVQQVSVAALHFRCSLTGCQFRGPGAIGVLARSSTLIMSFSSMERFGEAGLILCKVPGQIHSCRFSIGAAEVLGAVLVEQGATVSLRRCSFQCSADSRTAVLVHSGRLNVSQCLFSHQREAVEQVALAAAGARSALRLASTPSGDKVFVQCSESVFSGGFTADLSIEGLPPELYEIEMDNATNTHSPFIHRLASAE